MVSVKRNLFYNIFLNISKVIFPLITAPYISRVMAADDLGLWNFATTYAGYFAVVALLGIPFYGAREIAKVRDDIEETNRLFSELFSIAILSTVLTSFIYFLSIILINQLSVDYIVFLIAGIFLFCSPFNIDWFYSGLENFKIITMRSLIIKALSVCSLFLFVRDKTDFIIMLLISVFSTIANDIWNFVCLYRSGYKVHFTYKGIRKHLKPLILLLASSLAVTIYTVLDTIMLGFMTAYTEVAYYTYAMHIIKAILAAVTSLAAVAVPRISYFIKRKQYQEVNTLINKSFSLVSFFSFPICVGIILISPTFIPLFLGSQFYGSVLPIQILSLILIFIGLNNLFAVQCLVGLGYDKLFLYSILVGTFTNFMLNLILIPYCGAVGASIASSVAEFFVLSASFYMVVKYTPVHLTLKKEFAHTILGVVFMATEFFLMRPFLDGWILTIVFVLLASTTYAFYQYAVKNQTVMTLIDLVTNNFKHNV